VIEEKAPEREHESCGCLDCRLPDEDNAHIRALHVVRHLEFERYLRGDELRFTPPSPMARVRMRWSERHAELATP
jgi:hypothetical protein